MRYIEIIIKKFKFNEKHGKNLKKEIDETKETLYNKFAKIREGENDGGKGDKPLSKL